MRSPRDIVVVGGSVAGIQTAVALRRRGYDGRIRVVSAETVPYYYRPALSKTFLSGLQTEPDVTLPVAADLDLDIWLGACATGLDTAGKRLTVEVEGDTVEVGYDGLVIATGLRPKRLPFADLDGIHYVRELAQARALHHEFDAGPRVVIIGGGLIGCEVAATARKLGLDVTVVETADNLLQSVLGPTVGRLVDDLHRAHGVRVLTGVAVSGVAGSHRVASVVLSNGERLPADVVVVAVGTVPQTGWLEGAGVVTGNGVVCAPNLRALGAEAVVAVGDVARIERPPGHGSVRIEHWDNAVRHADVAARTLLEGENAPAYSAHATFWSTQFDLQLHVTGHPAPTDQLLLLEGTFEGLSAVAAYRRDGRTSAILSLNRPQRLRAHRHLLDAPQADALGPAALPEGVTR